LKKSQFLIYTHYTKGAHYGWVNYELLFLKRGGKADMSAYRY
jgi:hypothetical protein